MMASFFKQIVLTVIVVIVCVVLHELGHLAAAKALGYEAVIRLNSVSLVEGASDLRDAVIVNAAGPLVTLVLAMIGVALSNRDGALGPTIVLAALMMRILAAVVSLSNPNDEARISTLLGLGMWTLPAIVVGLLAVMMIVSARRSGVGWGWLLGSWIGASIGFAAVVFAEPHLPAITV